MHVTQSIHQVCERVFKLVSLEMPDNVTLVRDYDPSLPELTHDPDQMEQVLLNITRNSLQALGEEGGTITLRTRTAFQLTLHGVRYRLVARIDIEDDAGDSDAIAGYAVLSHGQRPRRGHRPGALHRPQSDRSEFRKD